MLRSFYFNKYISSVITHLQEPVYITHEHILHAILRYNQLNKLL